MDSFIFGFLRSELEFFFEDFNKDDLNASLKGDIELQNLKINTAVIQDLISPVVPFVEIEKAVVNKLKLNVPITSLKTKPTTVTIDRIDVFLKEPITILEVQDLLKNKFKIKDEKKEKTGKYEYTLPDRVLDGLKVVVGHIHLTFALNGRFRNAKKGLWTPHVLDINIYDFELYSTNEKWEKVELQQTREYTHGKEHVWVFKEATCKVSCRLVPYRDDNTSYRKTGVVREPVSFFEKLPIKAQITSKRLNANEKIGTEVNLFVGSSQISLTARYLSHVAQWAEALSEAFIREDLKEASKGQTVQPPDSNLLLNVILDQFKILLVEENGDNKTDSLLVQLDGLQINKFTDLAHPNDGGVRFLLSQLSLADIVQDRKLFNLFKKPESKNDIIVPLPEAVYVHPVRIPLPKDVHLCGQVIARFPLPQPPIPCFEYTINTFSSELVVERDGIERLLVFALSSHLYNAELPYPSESDYSDPKLHKEEAKLKLFNIEENDIYYEMDLLPSKDALIKFDCSSEELRVSFPAPGGADKPYAEFVCSGVHLTGDPLAPTLPLNEDFLKLTSPNGIPIVQPHDFFYTKFHQKTPEYTPKFQVDLPDISINWVSKKGEAGKPICKLTKTTTFFKIYSMLKVCTTHKIIANFRGTSLTQLLFRKLKPMFIFTMPTLLSWKLKLLGFLKDHFLYGASSDVKEMLEKEVKKLATDLNPRPRGMEYLVKNKILKMPTYLLNIATDKVFVGLQDKAGKDLFNFLLTNTSSISEKHSDRQIIMGKLGDLRAWAVPGEEKSLVRAVKKKLADVSYSRTEWRTFAQGKSTRKEPTKTYLLGNTDGIVVNINMDTVYNCLDYLVNILGDTIVLGEETAGSNYMKMMGKYAEILFVTGLPSEANNYWKNLREVSQQLYDVIGDVVWDVNFSNFDIIFGDDDVKFKPFTFDSLQITSAGDPTTKETTSFKILNLQGAVITNDGKKEPFYVPFDFAWEWSSERNPDWKEGSSADVPKFIQKCDIGTTPAVSVHLSPDHFKIASKFFFHHVEAFHQTCKRLTEKVERKINQSTPIVTQEDARTVAQGLIARSESPNNVNALKKALAASEKIVADAQSIQFDLSTRNAELQMKNMELESKAAALQQKVESMEMALVELQEKLVNLQMAQLSGL